jgi:hypothetical protein
MLFEAFSYKPLQTCLDIRKLINNKWQFSNRKYFNIHPWSFFATIWYLSRASLVVRDGSKKYLNFLFIEIAISQVTNI